MQDTKYLEVKKSILLLTQIWFLLIIYIFKA